MSATIRLVNYRDIFDAPNATELFDAYARECSIPSIGAPNPQIDIYDSMSKAGLMHCFGAYDNDALIGFAVVLSHVLPHYSKRVATVESLFTLSAYRRSGVGAKLLSIVESFACADGCVAILYSAPSGSTFERLLSRKQGYAKTNAVYCKELS